MNGFSVRSHVEVEQITRCTWEVGGEACQLLTFKASSVVTGSCSKDTFYPPVGASGHKATADMSQGEVGKPKQKGNSD